MKLNLGSGYSKIPGYLTVDIDPNVNPDYLLNLELDILPLNDNSVDEILAFHVLEHIGSGFFKLMQEMYRVCKDQSKIFIKVPYHRSDMFSGDLGHVRAVTGAQFSQFSKKNNKDAIDSNGGSSYYALQLSVDFELVDTIWIPFPDWEIKFKTMTKEERDFAKLHYWNVYSEEHILLKVIKE